ncbi:MAG TPA: tRNA nucleotidyltransferase, partial [Flavisolibacter sp.]|nr:tRNA nucleotidyltransferase [Flavisolibacter sp.]
MEIPCSDKELEVFKKVSTAAASLHFPCYLIGGFVRDKMLERATKDADFVCVGDGLELAKAAAVLFRPQP